MKLSIRATNSYNEGKVSARPILDDEYEPGIVAAINIDPLEEAEDDYAELLLTQIETVDLHDQLHNILYGGNN